MSKLNQLKSNGTDTVKVLTWLAHINEKDQQIIDGVVEQCKSDPDAMRYFVKRHDEDVMGIPQVYDVENAA
jgi:hypothetical protein